MSESDEATRVWIKACVMSSQQQQIEKIADALAAAERRGMVKGLRMAAAMSKPNSIIISDFILTRATQLEQGANSEDNR